MQSDDLGPGSQVNAPDVAANAVNGSDVLNDSLGAADIIEGSDGAHPEVHLRRARYRVGADHDDRHRRRLQDQGLVPLRWGPSRITFTLYANGPAGTADYVIGQNQSSGPHRYSGRPGHLDP